MPLQCNIAFERKLPSKITADYDHVKDKTGCFAKLPRISCVMAYLAIVSAFVRVGSTLLFPTSPEIALTVTLLSASILFLLSPLPSLLFCPQEQAAATVLYCAAHPSLERVSGLYWYECQPVEPSPDALDPELADGLWGFSHQLIHERARLSDSSSSEPL